MKNNSCYTFVVHYDEGTFVSQIFNSKTLEDAVYKWFDEFVSENSDNFNKEVFMEIEKNIKDEDYTPMLLTGTKNVWCNDLGIILKSYFSMTIIGNTTN